MAASTSRPSSPLLPAFGIRDLNSPPSSLGVVQVSRRQYDNTIRSQPDATLSYIDLDDGEVITVGSSFELCQRLEEPVSPSTSGDRSPISLWPAFTNAVEEKQNKIHIFDIRRTSGSLAVWRDHEAYSSKSLRKQDTSSATTSRSTSPSASGSQSTASTSTTQHVQGGLDDVTATLSKLCSIHEPTASCLSSETAEPQPAQDEPAAQLDKALNDVFTGLQSHLGPLADFLEATANGLRKIAEKTREADSTPVENVLNGFKSIVTEVGQLGLEFLATLDEELEKTGTKKASGDASEAQEQQLPPKALSRHGTPNPRPDPQPDNESVAKKVSFIDATHPIDQLVDQEVPGVETQIFAPPPDKMPFAPLGRGLRQKCVVEFPPSWPKPSLMTTFAQPGRLDTAKNSIIDSQPSDSDVLTRYPPLPSLRKAASVSGLRGQREDSTQYQPGLSTTSALSRYPSICQLEQQSRIGARNEPNSKPRATLDSELDWTFPLLKPKRKDIYKKPTVEDVDNGDVVAPAVTAAVKSIDSCTHAVDYLAKIDGVSATPKDAAEKLPSSWYHPPPPGAWPEQKMDNWCTTPSNVVKAPPAGSPKVVSSTQGQISSGLSSRISSPVSETYNRAPIFPRKSNTVSGTNPAARLNGPFDPLAHIPVLQPRPQRSQPDLSVPKLPSSSDRYKPAAFSGAFPRRTQTVHYTDRYKPRDSPYQHFRPSLWENYVKDSHRADAKPTAPSYPRPWSFHPEASRPFQGPQYRGLKHPDSEIPALPALRPVHSMSGLRLEAGKDSPSFTSLRAPPAPTPQHVPAPTQTGTVDAVSRPSLKPIPHPDSAPAPIPWTPTVTNPSRSSSILSPCPPAFTHRRGRSGTSPPTPFASKGVDECIRQLKAMGFGSDPNELTRLNVYAGAAAGDVEAAIEMIEEDREAARELEMSSQISREGSIGDLERDLDAEENPWED
ncbi:hypothetical protein PV04_04998 [Phialophora macrospora]|uniref:Uncharacterized protein n=1 Tax=Phialophora macrospora TaxID=1851006 RepID=A0A0D2FLY1_9EURO|nr:hypothetical protein PV04_04998 [Phialophora macrospora]